MSTPSSSMTLHHFALCRWKHVPTYLGCDLHGAVHGLTGGIVWQGLPQREEELRGGLEELLTTGYAPHRHEGKIGKIESRQGRGERTDKWGWSRSTRMQKHRAQQGNSMPRSEEVMEGHSNRSTTGDSGRVLAECGAAFQVHKQECRARDARRKANVTSQGMA